MSSALVLSQQPHQAAGAPVFLWSMKTALQEQMCAQLCSEEWSVYLGQRSEELDNLLGSGWEENATPEKRIGVSLLQPLGLRTT